MYENFILQQFENGKLEGYSRNVDDPEKVICIVHGIGSTVDGSTGWQKRFARKHGGFGFLICVDTENLLKKRSLCTAKGCAE